MNSGIQVEIAGTTVNFHSSSRALVGEVGRRYANFVKPLNSPSTVDLTVSVDDEAFADLTRSDYPAPRVALGNGKWRFEHFDCRAEWFPETGKAWAQAPLQWRPIEFVFRMIHLIVSAQGGGFLLHAASAIRDGRAFVFPGASGAGKSTISGLLPRDATLLTDEISYILPGDGGFRAFGTPFISSLGISGANVSAPLKAVYLLAQGPENKIEPIPRKTAVAALFQNVLIVNAPALITPVFETICRVVESVPVYRLTFRPTPEVWEMIP